MQKFLVGLICLSLGVGFTLSRAAKPNLLLAAAAKPAAHKKGKTKKATTGKKATAKELVAAAKKALAGMVKNARADKGLDPKTPKNKPFYGAVKKIAKELDRAEKGLASKSNDFFDAVSDARTAEEQMKIDWQLTDSKNQKVIDDAKRLGHALAILRTDFSKEAARKKKGGELTDREKAEFEKIKAQQKDLIAKIGKLKGKAAKDKALVHGLTDMEKNAKKIVDAPLTVNAFVATLYLIDEIEGQLYGYDYYIDKDWRSDWIVVDTYVTSWETTYDEFVSVESYEWASVEVSVDIELGEEVEVTDVSESEVAAEESWAENESFEMSDAEEAEVAEAEDSDEAVDSDDSDDDDSMDDASDDEGEDFDGGDEDDGGGDEDDNEGQDDAGGEDDGGGDDGE